MSPPAVDCLAPAPELGLIPPAAPVRSRESRVRSVLKAVSWRIVGTFDTIVWSWIVTGKLRVSLLIGSAEAVSKIGLFYLHERIWLRITTERIRRLLARFRPEQERRTGRSQVGKGPRNENRPVHTGRLQNEDASPEGQALGQDSAGLGAES